jgi:mono/diheme cytochrome c family protein
MAYGRPHILVEDYNQNVFVCLPEINAIKRNILTFHGDSTSAKQAWEGKEFIASMDKGFRPVSLANGPDGSMYVVDMHRGIIQHTAYSSPYYRKKAKASQIDTLVNYGRILKITAESTKTSSFNTDLLKENLLASLNHRNGWIRDRAQQKLIQNHTPSHIPLLENLFMVEEKSLAQLHALYVLEGTQQLSFDFLTKAALSRNPQVVTHSLVLLEGFVSQDHSKNMLQLFTKLQGRNDIAINLYLASTLGSWAKVSQQEFLPFIAQLLEKNYDNQILTEALISGLSGQEEALFDYLKTTDKNESAVLKVDLKKVMDNKITNTKNRIYTRVSLAEDNRTKGAKVFRQICASCHGINGEGMEGLAPPLIKSEYVSEPVERLALILLHGLNGPVHVNGERYEFNQAMPGLTGNEAVTDKDLSDIISYVSIAFSDNPKGITAEKIKKLRSKKSKSGGEYTAAELLELY